MGAKKEQSKQAAIENIGILHKPCYSIYACGNSH